MKLRHLLMLLVSFPLFFSASISAQTSVAKDAAIISGTVYDPQSNPVPGAKLNLLNGLIATEQIESDARGAYRFVNLPSGNYEVVANAPGLTALTAAIQVQSGQSYTADLRLALTALQEQVVVSASLGGELAPQTGSSVTVVDQEELQSEHPQTLADALRNIPGVEINRSGSLGTVTSAFVRGGNSNYNLILVDGIPMNDFGGGFDLAPLPVDGVDEVEVTRGPQSALYGLNAVSSVIDVITQRGDGPPHFSFLGEGGSYDTYRLATEGSGITHGFSWAYSLARLDTQGMVADDTYRNQTSFVSLGYSRSPRRKIIFHFFGDAGREENPGPFGSDPDGLYPGIAAATTLQNQNVFGYQVSYTERVSNRLQQITSVSVSTDRFSFPASTGSSFTNNFRIEANTRSELTLSPKDALVAGFEYDREQFLDTFVADASGNPFELPRDIFAFFAENRWNASEHWFLTTGVRVDTIRTASLAPDGFGSRPFIPAATVTEADPRVAVAYLPRQSGGSLGTTRIHTSFGTGIRPPDGFELGFTNNPNLKPEKNISFDAGVEQGFFGDKATVDVTYFYNRFKDQIITLGGSFANLSTFSSANISNSRADGLENSLRIRPIRSLAIRAEYTWLNSQILALNNTNQTPLPFQVGEPLLRRPRSSAGYDITWTYRRLMLNSNASIRGAVLDLEPNLGSFACTLGLPCVFRNPGYVDVNAGFAYDLPHGVEVYGRLNNLLNEKYEEAFGYPSLHLNYISGIKLNLGGGR